MNRRELSPRESAVAELVPQGLTNPQIAARLGIAVATTKQNVGSILIKWNCDNRTQIAVEATRRDIQRNAEAADAGAAAADGPLAPAIPPRVL